MGLAMPQTSTHFHSAATHAHTSSHSALLSDNNPLCGVTALVWILNPPALDTKDTSDYVSNGKLPDQIFKSGNVSPGPPPGVIPAVSAAQSFILIGHKHRLLSKPPGRTGVHLLS